MEEYEQLLRGAQAAEGDATIKYQRSLSAEDPIVASLLGPRVGAGAVHKFELMESRWNGNEILRYDTDKGPFCVKMNRVEPTEVFTAESLGLVTMAKSGSSVRAPKPLDLGKLPLVGDIGPGSFLVMEWVQAVPFGVMRPDNQVKLGNMVAEMHLQSFEAFPQVHKGRYGFPVNNWLSLTAQPNDWTESWPEFFSKRLQGQISRAYTRPSYGGAAGGHGAASPVFAEEDPLLRDLGARICKQLQSLLGVEGLRPALLHGDLWIGNTLADKEGPLLIDPACYFGHSEAELAIMELFGGFSPAFFEAYHSHLPKAGGFDVRQRLYKSYHWLNQFNLFGDPRAKDAAVKLFEEVLAECDA